MATEKEKTTPTLVLSKYERSRLSSHRVSELENNAKSYVPHKIHQTLFQIASDEIDSRVINVTVQRMLPGGSTVDIHLSAFPVRRNA